MSLCSVDLLLQAGGQHGLRVRCASPRWGTHQPKGVNERGQGLCSMELLFTIILKQVLASSEQVPASSEQVPTSSKSPKEKPTLLTSARCHASNVSMCKQCREEQQIPLMDSETGRTHHCSRANCIPDMYIPAYVHRGTGVHPFVCTLAKVCSLYMVLGTPFSSSSFWRAPVASCDILCLTKLNLFCKCSLLRYWQINQYLLAVRKHESLGQRVVWVGVDNRKQSS